MLIFSRLYSVSLEQGRLLPLPPGKPTSTKNLSIKFCMGISLASTELNDNVYRLYSTSSFVLIMCALPVPHITSVLMMCFACTAYHRMLDRPILRFSTYILGNRQCMSVMLVPLRDTKFEPDFHT